MKTFPLIPLPLIVGPPHSTKIQVIQGWAKLCLLNFQEKHFEAGYWYRGQSHNIFKVIQLILMAYVARIIAYCCRVITISGLHIARMSYINRSFFYSSGKNLHKSRVGPVSMQYRDENAFPVLYYKQ